MRFAALIFILALAPPLHAHPTMWSTVADTVEPSVVLIQFEKDGEKGFCSGFVIDSTRQLLLTAAHCDGEKILAEGTTAFRVWKDEARDLLVLYAGSITQPAIPLARRGARRGEEVASLGFGFGGRMIRIAHVSNTRLDVADFAEPLVVLDGVFVSGQSGGPVVNAKGELVVIVQRTALNAGFGIGADTLRDRIGRYFESR